MCCWASAPWASRVRYSIITMRTRRGAHVAVMPAHQVGIGARYVASMYTIIMSEFVSDDAWNTKGVSLLQPS